MQIDVALLPAEALAIPADCHVVVDVLRATTTMATLFERGLERLLAVDDIEVARARASEGKRVLLGEVGGLTPEGFDYGNSPLEVERESFAGREAVHFTTNGTRALCALAGRGAVFAGAIANCGAIAEAVRGFDHVVITCAGQAAGQRFGQDDFFAAGVIVARLMALEPSARAGDAARLAMDLASDPQRLAAGLRDSEHAQLMYRVGVGEDIEFALRADTSAVAPRVIDSGSGWAALEA